MVKRLKKPTRTVVRLAALAIIFFALLLQTGRLLLPGIQHYQSDIEAFVSDRLNATVRFSQLAASWHGLLPEVIVSDLTIVSKQGRPVASIGLINMQMDILASLFYRVPIWRSLEIDDLNLIVEQNDQGGWVVGDLGTASSNGYNWRYRNPGALFLMASKVTIDTADITFQFHNERQLKTHIPRISIQNNGDFHRLTAEARIEDKPVLNFVLEGIGNPSLPNQFFASAYLQLQEFPLERLDDLFTQAPETDLTAGSKIDLDLWFDFASPSYFLMNGYFNLNISRPSLFAEENFVDIPLNANITGDYAIDTGLTMDLHDTKVDDSLTISAARLNLHQDKLSIAMDKIDISQWTQWGYERLVHQQSLKRAIESMSPSGLLENIHMEIDLLDPVNSGFKAHMVDASINSWKNVPAFQQLNGYVETKLQQGFIYLQAENFYFHPPKLYEQPLVFPQASGYVSWQLSPKQNRISIFGSDLMVDGDFGNGKGYFGLQLPWQPGSYDSIFTVQLGVKNSKTAHYPQFIPNRFPKKLKDWMEDSIQGGRIPQAGFLYRGGFKASKAHTLQLFATVIDGKLKQEDWPLLKNIDMELVVRNDQMMAEVKRAQIYPSDRFSGIISWNKQGQKRLRIKASGKTKAESGLRFIEESWFAQKTNGFFDSWTTAGFLQVKTDLSIPMIHPNEAPLYKLGIKFLDNDIHLNTQRLTLNKVSGDFFYTSGVGFNSQDLALQLFDKPTKLYFSGNTHEDNKLYIQAIGATSVTSLSRWAGQTLPASIINGDFDYQLKFAIPLDENQKQRLGVEVFSDLRGISINLPKPLAKTKQEERHFLLKAEFNEEETKYRFELDKNLLGKVLLSDQHPVKIQMSISDEIAKLPNKAVEPGIFIAGDFSQLDLRQWQEKLSLLSSVDTNSAAQSQLPFNIKVTVDSAAYGETQLSKTTIVSERQKETWRTVIDSPVLKGNMLIPKNGKLLVINMDYIHLSEDKNRGMNSSRRKSIGTRMKHQDPLADIDISSIPSADVSIKQLTHKQKNYGSWSFKLRTDGDGVTLQKLTADIAGLSLTGRQSNPYAYLRWQLPTKNNPMYTQFSGELQGGDIQQLFRQLGIPPVLESESTTVTMELNWSGSPALFSIDEVNGQFGFDFQKGVFAQEKTNNATGILKLFGLMNFDTWARRIRLDFTDLYKEGLVFDHLEGQLDFNNGLITTPKPVTVKSPSGKLSLAGTIDYNSEQVDGELVATLPIGGNLTIATALAAGLPAAAGVYIISKLFRKQVDQVSSIKYSLTGDWDNPTIKVVTPKPADSATPEFDGSNSDEA